MKNQDNWETYYQKKANKPPRMSLVKAIDFFKNEQFIGIAYDLGAGAGTDTSLLLKEGWFVEAIDNQIAAKNWFQKKFTNQQRLNFQLKSFEKIKWKKVDLIHAGFALPFCPKRYFNSVMTEIIAHIRPGGRFSGNFFGEEHSWKELKLLSKEDVEKLFMEFEFEYFKEEKREKLSTLGEKIWFHNITIIAKKLD